MSAVSYISIKYNVFLILNSSAYFTFKKFCVKLKKLHYTIKITYKLYPVSSVYLIYKSKTLQSYDYAINRKRIETGLVVKVCNFCYACITSREIQYPSVAFLGIQDSRPGSIFTNIKNMDKT